MFEEIKNKDVAHERALLVGIYGPKTPRVLAKEYLEELQMLARTAGAIAVDRVLQNRMHPDPATYVGSGKLRELKAMAGQQNVKTLIFDDDLSPTQIRNIEKATKVKVLDRSGLILDIFASRAQTAAAKTQVELAQLQYLRPRLTRFWTHLSRQQGGIGTRGPGESQIEMDRRMIDKRIATLQDKLDKIDQQRKTQRKGRSDKVRISLVGYTNAGKSTLMNTLTETKVLTEDRLFATLDSTVRKYKVESHDALLSDTVGFIRKLPHNLIESFKSTLDEVRECDILLHVVDASSRMIEDYMSVVNDTLEDMEADDKKQLVVFNKIDAIEPHRITELKRAYPDAVFVSAERNIGIDELEDHLRSLIEEDYVTKTVRIPASKYEGVAFLHREAKIMEKEYVGSDIKVTFSIDKADLKRLKSMLDRDELTPSVAS